MRLPRLRFSIRRMMITVAVVAISVWAYTRYSPGWPYYAGGWWDAGREIWRGEATIYSLGGLIMGDVCLVDRDTGLPIRLTTGCVIGPGDRERVHGHNDHIQQYIRWHGLPGNTLKPWLNHLLDLKRFFDEQSHAEAPRRLFPGGSAVVSPDGTNSVRPIAGVKDDGSPSDSLKVIIAEGDLVLGDWYVRIGKGDSDLVWGPEGSRFAVVRSISEKTESYEAYDLRTGLLLCTETWDDKRRQMRGDEPIPVPARKPESQPPYPDLGLELLR
jgi:hypothetical protein